MSAVPPLTRFTSYLLVPLLILAAGCSGDAADEPETATADSAAAAATAAQQGVEQGDAEAGVVEVTARDYSFQAPDSIPSGWTTFRFTNQGQEVHFFVLDRLPEGRTLADFVEAVGPPFDSVWNGLQAGTVDPSEVPGILGAMLPEWFAGVTQTGGPGLVAPGRTAQASVRLEPGTYVMECYVKTADGVFHTSLGMARELTVTEQAGERGEPTADLEITFGADGMRAPDTVSTGEHTIAVHFDEPASGILANDVHVARLEDGQTVQDLVPWMSWVNVPGLRAPAPAEFLGGTQEVPVGGTAYFTVELEPGRYAWISENAENGMAQAFTVR